MEKQTIQLTPEQTILVYFDYVKEMDGRTELPSNILVNFCLSANCPSAEIAEKIISRLVKSKQLNSRVEGNDTFYSLNRPVNPELN